jgi:hypothetical protein
MPQSQSLASHATPEQSDDSFSPPAGGRTEQSD